MTGLAGKVAIVTGGSRGIGRAIAEAFTREGALVTICGRKPDALEAVARENGRLPGRILPVACHVGKSEDLLNMVDQTEKELGPIDILVNNAATNVAQGFCLDIDEAQFDKMIEVNLKSAFRLINLVAPRMCQRRQGSIINISSVSGLRPQMHGMMYSVTKAALIMMTHSYALELGPYGVRVNTIAPGLVQTALSRYYWEDEERRKEFTKGQPIDRLGQPEDIAEFAVLLASGNSAYMTGQTIVVDGGRSIT